MVADAQRVGHRRERRIDGTDARKEACVDDVEVVEPCALQFQSSTDVFGSFPKRQVPAWCATPEKSISFFMYRLRAEQVVLLHVQVPQHRLELLVQLSWLGNLIGRRVRQRDDALAVDGDAVVGAPVNPRSRARSRRRASPGCLEGEHRRHLGQSPSRRDASALATCRPSECCRAESRIPRGEVEVVQPERLLILRRVGLASRARARPALLWNM